jgi:hypothetical protein
LLDYFENFLSAF